MTNSDKHAGIVMKPRVELEIKIKIRIRRGDCGLAAGGGEGLWWRAILQA
jgi:hypothetical protein